MSSIDERVKKIVVVLAQRNLKLITRFLSPVRGKHVFEETSGGHRLGTTDTSG